MSEEGDRFLATAKRHLRQLAQDLDEVEVSELTGPDGKPLIVYYRAAWPAQQYLDLKRSLDDLPLEERVVHFVQRVALDSHGNQLWGLEAIPVLQEEVHGPMLMRLFFALQEGLEEARRLTVEEAEGNSAGPPRSGLSSV